MPLWAIITAGVTGALIGLALPYQITDLGFWVVPAPLWLINGFIVGVMAARGGFNG